MSGKGDAPISSVSFVVFACVAFASVEFASVRFASVKFALVKFASVRFALVRFASVKFASIRFASVRFALVKFACIISGHITQSNTFHGCMKNFYHKLTDLFRRKKWYLMNLRNFANLHSVKERPVYNSSV